MAEVLLTAKECAKRGGWSLSGWREWQRQRLIPEPVRVGRSVRWRESDIDDWIAAGCPSGAIGNGSEDVGKKLEAG